MQEKMEYQLEERTRDMQELLESCQTKVCCNIELGPESGGHDPPSTTALTPMVLAV